MLMRIPYTELAGLEDVYLEDSYVLGLREAAEHLVFLLDVVLTEHHPAYQPPPPDQQYCYHAASLEFPAATRVTWLARHFRPLTDASGAIDYGNIDLFYKEHGHYYLEGDWGKVLVVSAPPVLHLEDAP
jgi:hypothetical protein